MPCDDTLKAILDGQDGSRDIRPEILKRYMDIAELLETMDTKEFKAISSFGMCRICSKIGKCRGTAIVLRWIPCSLLLLNGIMPKGTLGKHFETLYEEIEKCCTSTDLEASDMAIEFKFVPDEDGIIPALDDPPVFKVAPIPDYISGQETSGWLDAEMRSSLKNLFETQLKSTWAVLLIHHTNFVFVDFHTIVEFFQTDAEMRKSIV